MDRLKKHPKYQKSFRTSRKLKAHDEKGKAKAGDIVIIQETRPTSKEKRWRILEVVGKSGPEESLGDEPSS